MKFIRSLIYIKFEWCLHWENEFYVEVKYEAQTFRNSILSSMPFNFRFYNTNDEI